MDFREGDVVGVKDTTTNEIIFGPVKLKKKIERGVLVVWDIGFSSVYENAIFHWWPLEKMKMGNQVPTEINPEEAREYYKTHNWPTVPNTGYEMGDPSSFNRADLYNHRPPFPTLVNIPNAVEGKVARELWDKKVKLPFQNGPGVNHFATFWPRTRNPERRPSRKRNQHFEELKAKKEEMRKENRRQTWKNYLERKKREANMRKNLNSAPANYRPIFSLSNHKRGEHPLSNILDGGRRTRRRRR